MEESKTSTSAATMTMNLSTPNTNRAMSHHTNTKANQVTTRTMPSSSDDHQTARSQDSAPFRPKWSNRRIKNSFSVSKPSAQTSNPKWRSRGRATSTKPHDAPMQKRDMYFALDCEMVGIGPDGIDSALGRISIINWDNQIVLDSFVQVPQPVVDYRTFVSGITAKDLDSEDAMSLADVQRKVGEILRGKILIGHGLVNDLKVIGISHPLTDVRDTATYRPFMQLRTVHGHAPEGMDETQLQQQQMWLPRKLKELAHEKLDREIQVLGRAHSPIEDATASMDLYKQVRNDWETRLSKVISSSSSSSTSNPILKASAESTLSQQTQQQVNASRWSGAPFRSRKVAVDPGKNLLFPPPHASYAEQPQPHQLSHSIPHSPPPGHYQHQQRMAARRAQLDARARASLAYEYETNSRPAQSMNGSGVYPYPVAGAGLPVYNM